jgi:Cft2 family RNA processing exonuclease
VLDFDDGVHLIGTGIFLDARRVRDRGIVSHAHRDHVARHRRWVASPATAALCARRFEAQELEVHPFHEPWEEEGGRVTLLPAGHILGSSMVLVERAGTRILYSGDFRLRRSATAEPCHPVRADLLVMECTFGGPRYRFPERAEVLDRVCEFVDGALSRDRVPVLLAYSLGKAQEAAALLGRRGFPVRLHEQAWAMLQVYRQFGHDFPGCEPYRHARAGAAVILPPVPATRAMLREIGRRRVAFLSGWALDPWRRPFGCEAAFPLSDHADYDELIALVRRVAPRRVFTLHGPRSFATRLRRLGYDAEPAGLTAQGSLF